MANPNLEQLAKQIELLEEKYAYQEATIVALNDELTLLNRTVEQQAHLLRVMKDRFRSLNQSPIASEAEETPPPHY